MAAIRLPMRRRRWPAVAIGVVVLVAILFTLLSGFVIDVLWYREIGQSGVFWTTLRTKILLGFAFGVVFFVGLLASLLIARRLTPEVRVITPEQEVIERFRESFDPYARTLVPAGAALLALIVGYSAAGHWQTFLLWSNSGGITFGSKEAVFGRDASFYVFSLPWLRYLQSWTFSALVGITLLTILAHVLWGGIRPQAPAWADKVTPAVRAHLSVLLGLIMLSKAWGYYLARFDLLTSKRGVVEGASYTDLKAQLPAYNFLTIVAVVCAVLFFVNIRVKVWSLPVIAVALLALVSVLLGTAYPAFVQRFRVEPQPLAREGVYIARNIEGTRRAFGLDTIEVSQRPVEPAVTPSSLDANNATISNIRLWRPEILAQNFASLQRFRQYYVFQDVDVDRYQLDKTERVLMVSGREIDQAALTEQGKTWQNQHLAYTHGFGAVASQVNTATGEGQPVFTLKNIPPEGDPAVQQPRIYFGEEHSVDYVVANTTSELDYEGAPPSAERFTYEGDGGIPMGGFFRRAIFAWRYKDVNLLISGQIHDDSRIMIYRSIEERAPRPVPFLAFDADPYLAVVDGKLVWIWDAYTTTTEYPYSQEINLAEATGIPEFDLPVNYIRNSVKVVVDAYDGSMTYYANLDEPIIHAWANAYPDLFTDMNTAPASVRAHFRYPENLFQVQAAQFANYHVTDPETFYQKQDFWAVPADPTIAVTEGQIPPKLRPYYLEMRLPGESSEGFQLVLPFVPDRRPNMIAWIAASSDPEDYGRLVAYTFPPGRNVEGPTQVFGRMNQDQRFSSQRTLLDQAGSRVLFGDFLVIPVDDSFIYVQPAYVRANQETAIPELKFVLLVNGSGGGISLGNSLSDALAQAVGAQVPPPPTGGGGGGKVAKLLADALDHFTEADAALRAGDLATYQHELAQAQALVEQAQKIASGKGGSTTTSPSPSASASASASP